MLLLECVECEYLTECKGICYYNDSTKEDEYFNALGKYCTSNNYTSTIPRLSSVPDAVKCLKSLIH